MKVLIIGGAGYIGSHTILELHAEGFEPVILDNFTTSEHEILPYIKTITGTDIPVVEGDYADQTLLKNTLDTHNIEAVIHFAASKAVGESINDPLKYYRNNVSGFVELVQTLSDRNIPLVFSSSAAVYGNPPVGVIAEETLCLPESPYGWSKLMDEIVLRDTCKSGAGMRGIALRYFNVVGAHESGQLGELTKALPQNLLPRVVKALTGELDELVVFGTDYPTLDGTCVRDYVHVVDLAKAHIAALRHILKQESGYYDVFNVGTGKPTGVLELITAFEKVNNVKVPYKLGAARAGDPVTSSADVNKIGKILGWKSEKTIEDACVDAWRWQTTIAPR